MADLSTSMTIIITGVVVVMVILAVLGLAVEGIIFYDNFFYKRAKKKEEPDEEDASAEQRVPGDIMAVIGLAMHQYFEEQRRDVIVTAIQKSRLTTWASSGRTDIMNSRQNVITRGK